MEANIYFETNLNDNVDTYFKTDKVFFIIFFYFKYILILLILFKIKSPSLKKHVVFKTNL